MLKRYKHILWDWNGTLLNDSWLCVEVLNSLLKKIGKPTLSMETYQRHFNFPVIDFYAYLGFETNAENFKQLSQAFIAQYEARWLEECHLHTDAEPLLDRIHSLGITHSILSAAHQEALAIGTRHFGIQNRFIHLLGTDNIYAQGKIARASKWLKDSPWKASELLLIGDTLHDFEVAEAMGIECLLIASGHCHRSRLEKTNATVLNSLSDCLELV